MNRNDFQQLADVRLAEALALLSLPIPLPDGAYYLAGYAVECGLKACIAKRINQYDFPDKQLAIDSYSHNLDTLARVAKLGSELDIELQANPAFEANWKIVKGWNEQSRYQMKSLSHAQELVEAISNPVDGVLPWIRARW